MLRADFEALQRYARSLETAELKEEYRANESIIAELTRDYQSYSASARASSRRYLIDAEQRRGIYCNELQTRGAL